MRILKGIAGLAIGLGCISLSADAHHSFAMFEREQTIKIAGTVSEFQWVNPHTWVQLQVPRAQGAQGAENWAIEGRSPNVLSRRGWNRRTLRAGDKVTLEIHPLKDGRRGGAIVSVQFANGLVLNADTPSAVDTNEER